MKLHEILNENRMEYIANSGIGARLVDAARKDHSFPAHGEITPQEVVQQLAAADPTRAKKALVWITNMYAGSKIRFEDLTRTREEIAEFFKNAKKLAQAGKSTDLTAYRDRNELLDALEAVADKPEVVSNKQQVRDTKMNGAVKVAEGDGLTIVKLLTHEAACFYGRGTKWCTTGEDGSTFKDYSARGPLYVLMTDNGRKFQLHFDSDQFMDERDNPLNKKDIAMLSAKPTYTNFLNALIQKYYYQNPKAGV